MPADELSAPRTTDAANIDGFQSVEFDRIDDNARQIIDTNDNKLRTSNELGNLHDPQIANNGYNTNFVDGDGYRDANNLYGGYGGYGRYGNIGQMAGYGGMMLNSPYSSGMGMYNPYGMYGMGMGMMPMGDVEQRGMMTFMVMSRLAEMSQAFTNVIQMVCSSVIQLATSYIGLSQQYQQMEHQTKEIDTVLNAEKSQAKPELLLDEAALMAIDDEFQRTGGKGKLLTVNERREIVETSRRLRSPASTPVTSVVSILWRVTKKMIMVGIAIFLARKIMGRRR